MAPVSPSLSDQLWQTRFGGSPGVIGRTIRIDGQPHTIVGVLPSGVDFPNRTEIWMPVAMDRNRRWLVAEWHSAAETGPDGC